MTDNRPKVTVTPLPTGRDEVVAESFLDRVHVDDLWFHSTSEEGINAELRPWLRMRPPKGVTFTRLTDLPVQQVVGRCPILLLGWIPVDYDEIFLDVVEPGRRFIERSRTSTLRLWGHERSMTPHSTGTLLRDRVVFDVRPSLASTRGLHRSIVSALFTHRHRRLRNVIAPRLAEPGPSAPGVTA